MGAIGEALSPASSSPPPPGLPRWSADWSARTSVPHPPRRHRACPGGAPTGQLEQASPLIAASLRSSCAYRSWRPGETWATVHGALSDGRRGLPAASSLAQFLAEHRGVRNLSAPPDLSIAQILRWADRPPQQTGDWPAHNSGTVATAPGETWSAFNFSLTYGRRGMPGGMTLAQLLAGQRGVRNHLDLPPLTVDKLLAWVDLYRERQGCCPPSRRASQNTISSHLP
jgi:hypothetical protein